MENELDSNINYSWSPENRTKRLEEELRLSQTTARLEYLKEVWRAEKIYYHSHFN